jgi:hypothetical protein
VWNQDLPYFINKDSWLVVKDQFLECRVCTNDEDVASNEMKNTHVLELARLLPKLQQKYRSKSATRSYEKNRTIISRRIPWQWQQASEVKQK